MTGGPFCCFVTVTTVKPSPLNFQSKILTRGCFRWYEKCKSFWKIVPDFTPYAYGEYAAKPITRGIFYGYDGLGERCSNGIAVKPSPIAGISRVFDKVREHGISFWRGTNTVIVNWPEGTAHETHISSCSLENPLLNLSIFVPNYDVKIFCLQNRKNLYGLSGGQVSSGGIRSFTSYVVGHILAGVAFYEIYIVSFFLPNSELNFYPVLRRESENR